MKCNKPMCLYCHMVDIPESDMDTPMVDIPESDMDTPMVDIPESDMDTPMVDIPCLILTYCKQIEVINPFDTFVAVRGSYLPGMPDPMCPFFELVVKEVFDNGQVQANMYDVRNGKRVFSQVANFAPPYSLKKMIHLGLFIPQSFFLQFTDGRVVHESDQNDLERGRSN